MEEQRSKAQLGNAFTEEITGNLNQGDRTYQGFVNKNFVKKENSNLCNLKLEKQEELVVQAHPEEQIQESSICGGVKLGKKRAVVLTVMVTILISAIIVPTAVILSRKPLPSSQDDTEVSLIRFQEQRVSLRSVAFPVNSGSCAAIVFLYGGKIQITEPFTRTTATCLTSGDGGSRNCEVTAPVLDIIDSIYQSEKQPIEKKWLNQFYKNTRSFMDNFQKLVMAVQGTQTSSDKGKIKIQQVTQKTLIDVKYNNDESKFTVGKYDDNLNLEEEEQTTVNSPQSGNQPQDMSWIDKILIKASRNLGQVIRSNMEVVKKRSSDLAKEQKKLIQKKSFASEWQDALINKCITLGRQLFRCTLDGVNILVPNFKVTDLSEVPSDVITTSVLVLKIEQSAF